MQDINLLNILFTACATVVALFIITSIILYIVWRLRIKLMKKATSFIANKATDMITSKLDSYVGRRNTEMIRNMTTQTKDKFTKKDTIEGELSKNFKDKFFEKLKKN